MNRQSILKAALILCAVILVGGIIMGVKSLFGFAGYSYADAGKYSSGDAEIDKQIKNLDIDWIDGKVNILYHGGKTINLKEKSDKDISKDMQMRWRLDGDTLRIRYAKPGFRMHRLPEKELTLTLPENIVLDDVKVNATSAALSIPALQAEKLTLDVTSGDITVVSTAKSVSAESTSGHIDLQITENAKAVSVVSTSGPVELDTANVDRCKIETTSGRIDATLKNVGDFIVSTTSGNVSAEMIKAKNADIDCTSGDVTFSLSRLGTLRIETTSGSVKAALPLKPGFTAQLKTTSGTVNSDLPLTKQGNSYTCGDGSGEVEIHTTSGSITITATNK